MSEDNNHIDYDQLISRYLSGNAGDAEVRLLEQWVLYAPENKARFNALREAWLLSGLPGDGPEVDVEQEWSTVAGQLFDDAKIVPITGRSGSRRRRLISLAAAAAVLLLGAVWLFRYLGGQAPVEVLAQHEVLENRLPDGTQIVLNQFSSVRYLSAPDAPERRVELTGDAFFEVERDTARPFVITTQNVEIAVLGTAFYVDARSGQSRLEVIVQSGSVAVTAGLDQVVLSAGETGRYDRISGELSKQPNDDVNYLAWRTEVLVFKNTPLERVVYDLNRTFHARISIGSPEIRNCELTATFENRSLDTIIAIIEKTLNITTEKRGEEIVFSGRGCE